MKFDRYSGKFVKVLCICPKCKAHHEEYDMYFQNKDKNGKPIRHKVECDHCMRMRVGEEGYRRYLKIREKLV